MRKPNFKNPVTDEEFTIATYTTRFRDGGIVYFDSNNNRLMDPKTKEPLVAVESDEPIGAPTILGSSDERRAKNTAYFKDRAKKHAKSGDAKNTRQKVLETEMGVQGFAKKHTNIKEI